MDVLVGRQPIFDKDENVYAYELLFRGGFNSVLDNMDEYATNDVIQNSLFSIGLDRIISDKLAFINFSKSFLIKGIPDLLPKSSFVIEILEHVEPDDEVIKRCKELKEKGYILALDDFVFTTDCFYKLFPYIDIIKIDWSISDYQSRKELISKLRGYPIKLLAEKVETKEEYAEAKELGCVYFQGFFFKKPDIIAGREIKTNANLTNINLIKEISSSDFDFEMLEQIVKKDPSLTFKILKFVNSVSLGVKHKVTSLKQAMVLIGIKELRKWMYLIFLRGLSQNKSVELLTTSIIRAHFCETLAEKTSYKERSSECFLLGMFSLLDALTGLELDEVVDSLPLNEDVKKALLGEENILRKFVTGIIAFEESDWNNLNDVVEALGINDKDIAETYSESIQWAHEIEL